MAGRPIGPEYFDISKKLLFMNTHSIDHSVISLANPWLDFLPASEAASVASHLNDDMQAICTDAQSGDRLHFFGVLPTNVPTTLSLSFRFSSLSGSLS